MISIIFTILEKKLFIFSETILKCYLMQITMRDKIKQKEQDLKYLPKQILQRSPMALAQIKAGNDSESLLHEITQIVYPSY